MEHLIVVQGKLFDVIGVADVVIAKMAEDYLPLKINGIDDKEGFKKVHAARMIVKDSRIKVEKKRRELKEDALRYGQAIDKEANRIKALIAPVEEHLDAEERAVDDALEAIKQEADRKKAEHIQKRIERLEGYGMGLIAGLYKLPFDAPGVAVPDALMRCSSDEQFEKFCSQIQEAINAENARLAEIETKRKAEEEERERLRKAEEERLAKIAAEQEAERKRIDAIAKEQRDKEVAARAAEDAEKRRKEMQDRLEQAERDKIAAELKAEQDRLQREREEWERIKAEEIRVQEAAKQKIIDGGRRAKELEVAKAEAAEKARLQAIEDAKREAQEKAEKEEKERIAAEKKAARAPDKEKLLVLAKQYDEMGRVAPTMTTDDGALILGAFASAITDAIEQVRTKAEAL